MRYSSKTDKNQAQIVEYFRKAGAHVLLTHQLKNAFDLLVGYRGRLFIVEVKDGTLPPSKRKLTEGEKRCSEAFSRVGVSYHIVESIEDAERLLKDRPPEPT